MDQSRPHNGGEEVRALRGAVGQKADGTSADQPAGIAIEGIPFCNKASRLCLIRDRKPETLRGALYGSVT